MTETDQPEPDGIDGAPHPREVFDLIGQSTAEDAFLSSFSSGRLHHAWLVTGPLGVGKATLAWRIARFLLAQPPSDGLFDQGGSADPASLFIAPDHPVAQRTVALSEPRLALVRRSWDEKAKRLKTALTVDEVRKLKGFFNLSAADGGWRVAIVDAADEMNVQAANALLKVLEEPPEQTIILLVCHQPSRVLPTIRSRCRTLRCSPLGTEDLKAVLRNTQVVLPDNFRPVSELSGGSAGEAVRLLLSDGLENYAKLVGLWAGGANVPRDQAIALADSVGARGQLDRFDGFARSVDLFLNRLARFGATQPSSFDEAAPNEARVLGALAPSQDAARLWATRAQEIQSSFAHARAVNLDPSSVILDMILKINQTAQNVRP